MELLIIAGLCVIIAVEVGLIAWIAWDIRQFKRKWRRYL
jgi:hypothetical protein